MTPWFPFFGRDFLAATSGWTAEERGHYLTLLIVQWEQGGLPDDVKRLELISPGLKGCWKTVATKFPVWKDGKRRNTRLEHERSKSHERSERARQSASQRWATDAVPSGDQPEPDHPDSQPEQCERICDRICDGSSTSIASTTMSSSPPPPAVVCDSWEQDWPALRAAWNTDAQAGKRSPWRSSQPPAAAADRLRESGWLDEAMKAIPVVVDLRQFDTPVTLGQFCQPGWVAKVLGGYFRDKKRQPDHVRGPRDIDDRPPPRVDPEFAVRKAATEARLARERAERDAELGIDADDDVERVKRSIAAKLREGAA